MVLTKKEEVDQFKRDLKSLNYYKSKRDAISDKLLELGRIMHEPKANRYEQKAGRSAYNYIELMEREDLLKSEYDLYDQLIRRIGESLERIEDIQDRNLLIEIYIRKNSYEKMALKSYMSVRNMKYHVDDVIRKIL